MPQKKKANRKNATIGAASRTTEDERELAQYVYEKRAQGWTFALICREGNAGAEEHFPYDVVHRIGKEYDAKHGKPKRIIRTLASWTDPWLRPDDHSGARTTER